MKQHAMRSKTPTQNPAAEHDLEIRLKAERDVCGLCDQVRISLSALKHTKTHKYVLLRKKMRVRR